MATQNLSIFLEKQAKSLIFSHFELTTFSSIFEQFSLRTIYVRQMLRNLFCSICAIFTHLSTPTTKKLLLGLLSIARGQKPLMKPVKCH